MLEVRKYTKKEIGAILRTNTKQGIDRKLARYEVEFLSSGQGKNLVYEITKIHNEFKVFCITEMGINAGTKFDKLKEFYYYLFCDESFATYPIIEMSRIMSRGGVDISRQTISNWLNKLEDLNYIHRFTNEYTYYAIDKTSKENYQYKEITKELYKKGWELYWETPKENGIHEAYTKMANLIGGHPYKHPKLVESAFYQREISMLIKLINKSFLEE